MNRYKTISLFLVKFFASYFLLFAAYAYYINNTQQKEGVFECSPLTVKVADQTTAVLNLLGYNASSIQHEKEMSVKLLIDNVYIARVIEGCNSMSIIILFISFIIAFAGKWLATVIYALIGSVIIYSINIIRIAFLTVLLQKYPHEQELLHGLVFPAIIYGTTFLLWVLWVQKFSNYKR